MNYGTLGVAALSLFVTVLTGCATSVQTVGSYKGLVGSDRSKATLYLYRDRSMAGAANQYDVLIDEKLVGSLPNGSFFTATADAGSRMVRADTGMGQGERITLESGKIYCMKLKLNFNIAMKSADVNSVSHEQCDREMRRLTEVRIN